MKSQTHYQVKIQAAGQVENKSQQYLPHKWRGNTLVPVIIALAISALATIAFLNQGANLAVDTKVSAAQNEIIALLEDYRVAKEAAGGAAGSIADFVTGNNVTYKLAQDFTAAKVDATSKEVTTPGKITFNVESQTACISLLGKVPKVASYISSKVSPACTAATGDDAPQYILTITLK